MPWGRLRVWDTGKGRTILAIHGLGGSGRYWQGLAEKLGEGWRVVAPDLAGFGRSDKPGVRYDRDLHLGSLDAVVTELVGGEPLTVVCHSIGGVIGALWAAENHERVERFALAAAPFPSAAGSTYSGSYRPRRIARFAVGTLRTAWPILSFPVSVARGYPREVVRDYGRQTIPARLGTLNSFLYDPELKQLMGSARPRLMMPALLAHAHDDRTVLAADQQRWAAFLPHADVVELPTGAHQFLLTQGFEPLVSWLEAAGMF